MTLSTLATSRYRGRFAPSPTGPLHLGSLVAALGSWLIARHHGGDWLLRMEDIDPPREVRGAAVQQIETLARLGMQSDEPVVWQSKRVEAYSEALDRLLEFNLAFECHCSRSDLAGSDGLHRVCVDTKISPKPGDRKAAVRLRVHAGLIGFNDAIQGPFEQSVDRDIGDFVLRRADGLWAYQLAVVVDDAAQRITDVVRGADLLDSTPRQMLLQQALALPTPGYSHLALIVDANGNKLGKSSDAPDIAAVEPIAALRMALRLLGQDPRVIDGACNADSALLRALKSFDTEALRRVGKQVAVIASTTA